MVQEEVLDPIEEFHVTTTPVLKENKPKQFSEQKVKNDDCTKPLNPTVTVIASHIGSLFLHVIQSTKILTSN